MEFYKNLLDNIKYSCTITWKASKTSFVAKIILSLLSSILPFLSLYLWSKLFNILVDIIGGKTNNHFSNILFLASAYSVIILLGKLLDTLNQVVLFRYNDKITYYLDNMIIDKVSNIDIAFFDSNDLKNVLQNAWNVMNSIQTLASMLFETIKMMIYLIVALIILYCFNPLVTIIVFILTIPSIICIKNILNNEYNFNKKHTVSGRKMEYYKSIFLGKSLPEVKLYDLKDFLSNKYNSVWNLWHQEKSKFKYKNMALKLYSTLLLWISDILIYCVTINKLIKKLISVGDVNYFITIMCNFRDNLNEITYHLMDFSRLSKEINDIRKFMQFKPFVETSGKLQNKNFNLIEFYNVSFKYPNTENLVLDNCSFKIKLNEVVGLVGLNGSGKSTIVKLLLRLYDPTEGEILLNGLNYKDYDINFLRSLFGVLFQDYIKYSLTVRENIALSDITRIDKDEDILLSCQKSKSDVFITKWEKGINENLTRFFDMDGKELSGGEWQRIALARAFFRNAPLIIFDEPSAALDPIAEHEIFHKISELMEGKSAVLISHRLSSITLVNKIIYLANGRIMEEGNHEELMKANGEYAKLYKLQAKRYT